jgi:hypothetical protein
VPYSDRYLSRYFWPKVRKAGPDECWQWLGGRSGKGDPYFDSRPAVYALWELDHAPVDPGHILARIDGCERRDCVNPAHRELRTRRFHLPVPTD